MRMNKYDQKKALRESIRICRKMFRNKKLNESTFAELIQVGTDLLDAGARLNASGVVPPLDKDADDTINIRRVLGTSEDDLNPEDGTKNESYYRKHSSLLQEREKSHAELIAEYKDQGGTANFDDYRAWVQTQPEPYATKGLKVMKSFFMSQFTPDERASAAPVKSVGADTGSFVPPSTPTDFQPSRELQDLLDLGAGGEYVERAEETVQDKYDMIELILRRVIRGNSTKRYYLLAGDAGIGKSYTVEKLLKEEGKENTQTLTGSIGKSKTDISAFLYEHRNTDLLVLDDCDAFLKRDGNQEVLGMLKGAMEKQTKYHVHVPQKLADRLTKIFYGKEKDESWHKRSKFSQLLESDEEFIDDEEELDGESKELDTAQVVPTDWTFNCRLVIISNLHENQIDTALWSRCDHYDLHLTQEEYMVRLAMIIDNMDCGQADGIFTEDEVREAKALLMTMMKAVIEAGNNGVRLFGKYIQLKQNLEFRLVKDLVQQWLAMVSRELELRPDSNIDDVKKKLVPKWVRIGVIPRLSA